MKKIYTLLLAVSIAVTGASAQSLNLGSLFGKKSTADSTSTEQNSSSGLGGLLGGAVDALTGTTNVDPAKLVGTWTYVSPAVDFASDNVLQKAGGVAAASALEKKLEPYYKKAGLDNVTFEIAEDLTFKMKLKRGTLNGTVEKAENGELVFNFKAFNKINIGKIATRAKLSVSSLSLTFDVSGLTKVLKTVASVSQMKSAEGAVKLLESYDGIYAGFKLNRAK